MAALAAPAPGLRYDGIYQAPTFIDGSDNQHFSDLRFMADGTVRRKESIEGVNLEKLAKGMTPDNGYVRVGTYKLTGNKLLLDIALGNDFMGSPMKFHAEGELKSDGALHLVESTTVGGETKSATLEYRFMPVAGL